MKIKAFITLDDVNVALQNRNPSHFVDLFNKAGIPVPESLSSNINLATEIYERYYDSSKETRIMLQGLWLGVTLMIWKNLQQDGYVVPPVLQAPHDITFPVLVTVTTQEGFSRQEFYGKPVSAYKFPVEPGVVIEMLNDYARRTDNLNPREHFSFFNWAHNFSGLPAEVKEKSGITASFSKPD